MSVSAGLSWTDVGGVRVRGGFARRFYQAVADQYGAPEQRAELRRL